MAYPHRHQSKSAQPRSGVFISYARSDGEVFAHRLRQQLETQQIKLWQDRVALEGGRDWWLQITEALDNVQFMALVVTPNALKSEIVRKEWRYARQQGVCIYPIKGLDKRPVEGLIKRLVKGFVKGPHNLDFNSLPRWMRDQHFYDLGSLIGDDFSPEWQKFLSDLNKTPDVHRVPFMVEDLPAGFVQRPNEFDQLVKLLLDQNREEPVAITAALRGAGGYGKTTIAKALCHDERIQEAFDDGILWVTLGENPGNLIGRVEELIQMLSSERPGFTNLEPAITRLRELLADRDILIVIDDVWNRDHLRPFMQGGSRCARLITTRNPNTLPDRAAEVKVDAMREAEAVALLGAELQYHDREGVDAVQYHDREGVDAALKLLAARLGEWPLLLKLANGVLRNRVKSGDTLPNAIAYANRALDKRGLKAFDERNPIERSQAAEMTLRVSLDQLTADDREHFSQLAIFPEDVYVPLATLEKYWELDELDTEELCDRLNQFSLLHSFNLGARTIRLHDVIRAFLRDERKTDLPALNNQLLDAHRPDDGWAEAPDDDRYLWDHLASHLIEAGCGEELVATVRDWRYLAKKIFLRKSHSVENDLIQAVKYAPDDDPLRALRRTLANTGHLFNHCETRDDLQTTIFSRLRHMDELQAIVRELERSLASPRIVPKSNPPDLPHPALIRTLEGHSSSVNGCAFSPDGKLIVSASGDGTLKVWDSETGQMLRSLEGHSSFVEGCAFSPDGKLIVSASWNRTLKVWDSETGQTLRSLEGHSAPVEGCAFSPDGKLIASASLDRTLKVWDSETGQTLRSLEGHSSSVKGCAFSPDSKLIVSASDDGTLKVWDAETGQMLRSLEGHSDIVRGCAFSPNGKLIVSASLDRTLKVWDAEMGQTLRSLEGHSSSVFGCAFSPDGKRIVSASVDRMLKVWDAETGQMLRSLEGHSSFVSGCAFSPDGKLIVSASDDGTLKVWDAETDQMLRSLVGHSDSVWGCAFSPDGKLIVSTSDDGTLKVWDAETDQLLRSLVSHSDSVNGCAFSPDGKLIVSASVDRTLKVWHSETGQMLRSLKGHSAPVEGCAFSPDGKLIVSASLDRTLKVWDSETGQMLRSLEGHSSFVKGCAFSPDGKLIVSASGDRTLKVWDSETGQTLRSLEGHSSSVSGCAFNPDGKLIASASWDRTLKVWDAETGQMLRSLEGHSDSVRGCAFSPNGKLIVSTSDDRTLKIWDSETGQTMATFFADGLMLCCVVYGEMIAAGGACGVYFLRLVR